MIQTMHDTGTDYPITPKMDGGVYGTGISDCVSKGIGDEFTLQYSSDSLTVQFNAGSQCIIGGAFFKVMSLEAITLTANSTIYLCANINLSNANGHTGSFVQRTASNMQSQNLNGSGTSRDLLLYIVTTSGNGVSNVSDRRIINGDGGAQIGDLDMTNIEKLTHITNMNEANFQAVSDVTNLSSTNLQVLSNLTNLNQTNLQRVSNINNLNQANLQAMSNVSNLNQTNLQVVSNGAVQILTSAPTSAYTGGGVKIVYLASNPSTKYNGYIYLIKG